MIMAYKNHPWASEQFPGALICDAASRLNKIKGSTDRVWLEQVIKHRDTQTTVRLAAGRRLRKLQQGSGIN